MFKEFDMKITLISFVLENGKQNGQNEHTETNGTNHSKEGAYFDSSNFFTGFCYHKV